MIRLKTYTLLAEEPNFDIEIYIQLHSLRRSVNFTKIQSATPLQNGSFLRVSRKNRINP
jgi:hypothetical protein